MAAIWDAETKINLIFIVIYGILFFLNIVNCVKYGITSTFGYIFLLMVSSSMFMNRRPPLTVVKIAGNALLFEVYTGHSTSIEVATWGLILSQLGFYPLLNATFSFIHKWLGPGPI